MKYKVVFTFEHEYIVEAPDEYVAVTKAEECLAGEVFETDYDGCHVTEIKE
jgi:hypothetical protein